ncbi:MAG TPA: DUF1345 domain-containing protein [Ramlibacter sp.]|nr:DUF1345 domain-containing protein [Ramlibacter sp.]
MVSVWRALKARPRLAWSVLAGGALWLAGTHLLPLPAAAWPLIAWNFGALLYLLLAWEMTHKRPVQAIQERSAEQDEGATAILVLVVLGAAAVLLAVGTQLAQVKELHGMPKAAHIGLAGLTVFTSWLFTQVLFGLHYAHDFYAARVRGEPDPLQFPGTKDPTYTDFFYFACIIGTSAQTADVSFTTSDVRPIGTLHCILAFFFNATLLALSINLVAGLLM